MNKLTKFILSVLTGAMLLGMTAFAAEYSVTPANAVFYTNKETIVLADAAENAQVILPECEAGLPILVTGVTSNGYWQIVLGDATYYVVGAGLSQTAESAEEVNESTPVQPVTSSYNIKYRSGYAYVDTVVSSYAEACAVAAAIGCPVWQFADEGGDNVWYYGMVSHVSGKTDRGTFDTDFRNAEKQFVSIMESRGYNPYPIGNHGRLNTKDGRIYIDDASGGSWSVAIFDNKAVQESTPAQASVSTQNIVTDCPYEFWKVYNNGSVAWFYLPGLDHGYPPEYRAAYKECHAYNRARYPYNYDTFQLDGFDEAVAANGATSSMNPTPYTANGKKVYQYFAV